MWEGADGDDYVIVLTQLVKHKKGTELKIVDVAGSGYVKNVERIYLVLDDFAKKWKCRWISGHYDRKAFGRIYDRFKPEYTASLFLKELNYDKS